MLIIGLINRAKMHHIERSWLELQVEKLKFTSIQLNMYFYIELLNTAVPRFSRIRYLWGEYVLSKAM